jgi:hypothetical protein
MRHQPVNKKDYHLTAWNKGQSRGEYKECKHCPDHGKSYPQDAHWLPGKPRLTFHFCLRGCPGVESPYCKIDTKKKQKGARV